MWLVCFDEVLDGVKVALFKFAFFASHGVSDNMNVDFLFLFGAFGFESPAFVVLDHARVVLGGIDKLQRLAEQLFVGLDLPLADTFEDVIADQ